MYVDRTMRVMLLGILKLPIYENENSHFRKAKAENMCG